MIAYNVPIADLIKTAEKVNLRVTDADVRGNGIKFKLRLVDDTWRAKNPVTDRRKGTPCWHGFQAFFDTLFESHPGAKVKTAMVTYDGAQDYQEKYADTDTRLSEYSLNVYSNYYQSDCCDCGQ